MRKKIFYYFVLVSLFVACSNKEETLVAEQAPVDRYAASKEFLADVVAACGNYDVESESGLLDRKLWARTNYYKYSENWAEMNFDLLIDGADGCSEIRYIFLPNGELRDWSTSCAEHHDTYRTREWSFNPETRTLTIDGTLNYHLIALGEDTFIWDYIDTWSGKNPRYFRALFKAKSIE